MTRLKSRARSVIRKPLTRVFGAGQLIPYAPIALFKPHGGYVDPFPTMYSGQTMYIYSADFFAPVAIFHKVTFFTFEGQNIIDELDVVSNDNAAVIATWISRDIANPPEEGDPVIPWPLVIGITPSTVP